MRGEYGVEVKMQLMFLPAFCFHCHKGNVEPPILSGAFPVLLLVESWLHLISA